MKKAKTFVVILVLGIILGGSAVGIWDYEKTWIQIAPAIQHIPELESDSTCVDQMINSGEDVIAWGNCSDLLVNSEDNSFHIDPLLPLNRKPGGDIKITIGMTGRIYAVCSNKRYKWLTESNLSRSVIGSADGTEPGPDVEFPRVYFRYMRPGEKI